MVLSLFEAENNNKNDDLSVTLMTYTHRLESKKCSLHRELALKLALLSNDSRLIKFVAKFRAFFVILEQ